MTFLALLTNEMRLRLRRERTIWVIIVYVLFMGLIGWFSLNNFSNYNDFSSAGLSAIGLNLYFLLSLLQLFLVIFITPAFTATAVNGEKERQTFDMLLCSRLSALSLVSGKLVAGLANALLLIAAALPLFSLVFFFGGLAPIQVIQALIVFVVTALTIGTLALLCSTLFTRPAISTAVAYMLGLLWSFLPLIIAFILLSSSRGNWFFIHPNRSKLLLSWNPIMALISTYPNNGQTAMSALPFTSPFSNILTPSTLGSWHLPLWLSYTFCDLVATVVFFLLSMWFIKPNSLFTNIRRAASSTRREREMLHA